MRRDAFVAQSVHSHSGWRSVDGLGQALEHDRLLEEGEPPVEHCQEAEAEDADRVAHGVPVRIGEVGAQQRHRRRGEDAEVRLQPRGVGGGSRPPNGSSGPGGAHLHECPPDLAVGDLARVPDQPRLPQHERAEQPHDHVCHLRRTRTLPGEGAATDAAGAGWRQPPWSLRRGCSVAGGGTPRRTCRR